MIEEVYSAGLISQSFWFVETKKLIKLICEEMTEQDIKRICIEENLFGTANVYRAKRIYGYLWRRVSSLDRTLIDLFSESDLSTQKIINLIAVLKVDRLFFEFVFEVYREKSILGSEYIEEADISVFFNNKEIQSEDVAKWTETTKRKLRAAYLNFMIDANLLTVIDNKKKITPPILDVVVERYLDVTGDSSIVKAITGVN